MTNILLYYGIETCAHIALYSSSVCRFSFCFILHILEIMQVRTFKLNIHLDNWLLYCLDDIEAYCSFPYLICPFFFLFIYLRN